jgi:hypothetical protein
MPLPTRADRLLVAALPLMLALAACSVAQAPASSPTLPPPPTLAPDATPPPTPEPCAAPADLPAGERVVPLDDFPLSDALEVTDVAWTGTQLVAVGFGSMPGEGYDGPRQGLAWTSCNGVAWQAIIDPALQYVTPTSVAAVDGAVFILGTLSTCGPVYAEECDDAAEAGNVVIRLLDDGTLRRLPQDPAMKGAFDLDMEGVGSRLAVHGSANDERLTYTLWLSSDGESWQATTELAGMDPIDALAATGNGGVLGFGSAYVDDMKDSVLIVASSSDGLRFSAVPAPQSPGSVMVDAAAGSNGYAAVGVGYPADDDFGVLAVALHSIDGSSWTEAVASDGSFEGSQLDSVHALPDGSGYVAVGYRLDEGDFTSQQGTLWHSVDGRAWATLGTFGNMSSVYTTASMGGHGLVVFSADQDDSADDFASSVSAYFAPAAELRP